MADHIGQRDTHAPQEDAVEGEGDQSLAAGSQREIGGVHEGVDGHAHCADADEACGQGFDRVGGVVEHREKRRQEEQDEPDGGAGCNGKCDQLRVGILGLIKLACAQELADHDGDGRAHCDEDDIEEVGDRRRDVDPGHRVKAAAGVGLVQKSHAHRPQDLIGHQRESLDCYLAGEGAGNPEGAVHALGKCHSDRVKVRPEDDDAGLHETADHGRDGRADYFELRETAFSED